MNGIFGEISTEVCGIAPCTGTTTQAPTSGDALSIEAYGNFAEGDEIHPITSNGGITTILTDDREPFSIVASGAERIYVNGQLAYGTNRIELPFVGDNEQIVQIIAQNGDSSPYITYLRLKFDRE